MINQQKPTEQSTGNAEGDIDVAVLERFFRSKADGSCIEIGAARPDWLSIGALFRKTGWDVVSIEPNPAFADLHRQLGHTVLEYACGEADTDDVDFSVVDSLDVQYRDGNVSFESWSSLAIKDEFAELKSDLKIKKIKVKVRRLDSLLKQYRPEWKTIDLITVDVEGWELEVLSGLDFDKYKPSVLIIENLFYSAKYRDFMKAKGYNLWRCEPPNDVYVRADLMSPKEARRVSVRNGVVTFFGRGRVLGGKLRRRMSRTIGR